MIAPELQMKGAVDISGCDVGDWQQPRTSVADDRMGSDTKPDGTRWIR